MFQHSLSGTCLRLMGVIIIIIILSECGAIPLIGACFAREASQEGTPSSHPILLHLADRGSSSADQRISRQRNECRQPGSSVLWCQILYIKHFGIGLELLQHLLQMLLKSLSPRPIGSHRETAPWWEHLRIIPFAVDFLIMILISIQLLVILKSITTSQHTKEKGAASASQA